MKYVCIHGHFYQPPRENPWLEAIEQQDSAYPYHDWNERITAECYGPNATSRILDGRGWIMRIVNNYSRISFNFGPTLLSWLESNASDVYQAILEADQQSQRHFSGHGSAIAQAYNHMILPLATRRDKHTQVAWGIYDFQHRFGRRPEGMWLPETAVDVETLEVLAEQGIKFTILAPHQAVQVRRQGVRTWSEVRGSRIDTTIAYTCHLPSGRSINLFFYDGPTARAVAFERLLNRGEDLAHRLLEITPSERREYSLAHIATDGETYGHHHRFGDMALAYAIHFIESHNLARFTNYGEFLEKHPPTWEVRIAENTSWSCAHGVERWRSDCGCSDGGVPGWDQSWRAPLRAAFDWLRDTVAPRYEDLAGTYLKDPWQARDDYISLVLDRSPQNLERFLARHASRPLSDSEKTTVLKLLELQRHAMLMYTSCGWFFNELSRMETVQCIQYAARAVQLSGELFGDSTEARFLELLERARSNIREYGDGRRIFERFVRPAVVDLGKVAAHYAASSLFEQYEKQARIYCYQVAQEDYQGFAAGRVKLAVGRASFTNEVTRESVALSFGVLHFGDHNLHAGVREYRGLQEYEAMAAGLADAFSRVDLPEVVRLMDRHFGKSIYSIKSLFRDEQRKVLGQILDSALAGAEGIYRQLYEDQAPMMRFLSELRVPLPKAFQMAAEFFLNTDLRRTLSSDTIDAERVSSILREASDLHIELDMEGLSYIFKQSLERAFLKLASSPEDIQQLRYLVPTVALARAVPFPVDMMRVQNIYYDMLKKTYPRFQQRAQTLDEVAVEWVDLFVSLGEKLSVRVPGQHL